MADFNRFVAELGEVPRPSLHRQLFDAYVEAAALRERVQAERERRESAENNMASWEDTTRRFVEQNAALRERAERLAGLLGEAVVFVEEAQIGGVSPADLRLLRRIRAALADTDARG